MDSVRTTLDRLIREQGRDYASLSRLLGRNAAYVQQFIHRGVPRKLDEDDRRLLARYFAVDESLLGGSEPSSAGNPQLVDLPRRGVGASAGGGATADGETAIGQFTVERRWVREMNVDPAHASIITVQGDSMEPLLGHGDEILVDEGDAAARLRDGVYVLRVDGALLVKRVTIQPGAKRISISSDNPAYPPLPDIERGDVAIVGRVVWAGRRLR